MRSYQWLAVASTVVAIVVLPICATSARAGSLITNGSFETYAKPSANWTKPGVIDENLTPGNTDIAGWTVINGNIDYIGGYWSAADGNASLDFGASPGVGGLEQAFATTPGAQYVLRFDFSGNPVSFGEPKTKVLGVDLAGKTTTFTFDVATIGNSQTNMKWEAEQLDFTADSTSTTLKLINDDPLAKFTGPVVDNVSVTAQSTISVPLPPAVWSGLAMLGGLGVTRWLGRRYVPTM